MSAAHTPGPWHMDRNNVHSGQIATVHHCVGGWIEIWSPDWLTRTEQTQEANAVLMLAAPAMLAKLRELAEECGDCAGARVDPENEPCEACADVWRVIDAAEGRV